MRLTAVFAVILTIVAHGGNSAGYHKQNPSQNQTKSSPTASQTGSNQKPAEGNQSHAEKDRDTTGSCAPFANMEQAPQRWRKREWVTFWANLSLAIFGLLGIVVGIGSMVAVLRQGSHIVNSERAWMVATMDKGDQNPMILPTTGTAPVGAICILRNNGKTPAFIIETGQAIEVIGMNDRLPENPRPYKAENIGRWEGRGIPLSPDSGFPRFASKKVENPVKIFRGEDVLWVYGYVRYRDAFTGTKTFGVFRGRIRETHYCFRWMPPAVTQMPSVQFRMEGPPSYNRAT